MPCIFLPSCVQVGIGGRYDPTNFIEAPAVSVITSIRYYLFSFGSIDPTHHYT